MVVGGAYEATVVVGRCVRKREVVWGGGSKKTETELLCLGFGLHLGRTRWRAVLRRFRTPSRGNLGDESRV
jgi:hypothetical protein